MITVLCNSEALAQKERRVLISKNARDNDKVLEFIIDHYIPIISRETPKDREKFKKLLKEWNPEIKYWPGLSSFDKIKVYRKSPLYDVSMGFHTYDNQEILEGGGKINTKSFGPTFDFRSTFVHDLDRFSYINLKILKKNDFLLESNKKTYSFPLNYFLEYGGSWTNQFSPWTRNLSASWEQISFLSFNSDVYKIRSRIESNLQVSTSNLLWLNARLDYRFTMFGKGTYLGLGGGYSILGQKSLDDNSKEEDVDSFKGFFSLKYYMFYKVWLRTYYQYAQLVGNTRTIQSQYGLYVGYTF